MHHRRYHFGDAAPVVVSPSMPATNPTPSAAPTVTGQLSGAIHLATRPVKWGVHTIGSVFSWAGTTLNRLSNKF